MLEVGAGTGYNLPYYPEPVDDLTLTDGIDGMLRRAERRAGQAGRQVETVAAPVGAAAVRGRRRSTPWSARCCSAPSTTRTSPSPRSGRVLKPDGQYLFLEHVRSDDPKVSRPARTGGRASGAWSRMGCHPNRDTLPRIEAAFVVDELEQDELPVGPKHRAAVRPRPGPASGRARPVVTATPV